MTDSSNNRSSIDSSLEGPHNSPAFLHDSTSASPRTEIPEQRPLPPLPTQDDGDETLNLGSEDEADDELSVYNTSFVPDDEGNRTSSPGVHSGEFHRHLPPVAVAEEYFGKNKGRYIQDQEETDDCNLVGRIAREKWLHYIHGAAQHICPERDRPSNKPAGPIC